jgi:DNA repair exonuclease SbcCD ATPase subunit
MREVEFQETGMKNFGPYIDPMILYFPNNKLSLLTGPNGIGKTMSLDSIPFTLYGITSKGARGDDVVNNTVGKNCKTWVKFKVNDDKYIATRYHKYTKYNNTVILNKNGTDIKKGHREVLPEIEKLICPQKAFMNTLMFGQKVKDFFTDLVDSDKKEIFRKLLGLEQYIVYYKEADKVLKEIKDRMNKLINQVAINKGLHSDAILQIKMLSDLKVKFYEQKSEALLNLSKSIEDNKRLLTTWNNNLESLELTSDQSIEEINKELMKVQNELAVLEKDYYVEVQALTKQQVLKGLELKEAASEKKTEITSEISAKITDLRDTESETKQTLSDLKTKIQNAKHTIELDINKLKSNQENCSKRILEIKSNVLDSDISLCPTCEQDVPDVAKEKLVSKTRNYQREIEIDKRTIEKLTTDKSSFTEYFEIQSKTINDRLSEIRILLTQLSNDEEKQKEEVDEKLKDLTNQVNSLVDDQKVKILSKQSENKKELEEKEKILQDQKEDREKLDEQVKEFEEIISSLKQDIKNIEYQIENKKNEEYDETQLTSYITKKINLETSIENKKQEIREIEKQITIHEFWKSGFSPTGIPSMLIDDSIPFMNDKISTYLDLLTNGRYIVSFDTLDETKAGEFRDKIAVHVIDTHTKANSRVQLSGGQTRIVDIATILTLGDLQSSIQDVKFNILLFDEIFDALDYDNANYVSKVLNKLKIDKSIYVISHQHQDQLEPDEILEFK